MDTAKVKIVNRMGAQLGLAEISADYASDLAAIARCGDVPLKLFPHAFRVNGEMNGMELVIEHTAAVEAFRADAKMPQAKEARTSTFGLATDCYRAEIQSATALVTTLHSGAFPPDSDTFALYLAAVKFLMTVFDGESP